jgi:hypothetical protein
MSGLQESIRPVFQIGERRLIRRSLDVFVILGAFNPALDVLSNRDLSPIAALLSKRVLTRTLSAPGREPLLFFFRFQPIEGQLHPGLLQGAIQAGRRHQNS